MYLWFKLLHIFFVISWFAGLFYLPRIYVNLAQLEPGQRGICTADRYVAAAVPLYVAFGLGNADIRRGHRLCQQLVGQRLAGG